MSGEIERICERLKGREEIEELDCGEKMINIKIRSWADAWDILSIIQEELGIDQENVSDDDSGNCIYVNDDGVVVNGPACDDHEGPDYIVVFP